MIAMKNKLSPGIRSTAIRITFIPIAKISFFFAAAVYYLNDLGKSTLILSLACLIAVLAYFFESLVVLPLIGDILSMIPGIGGFFLAEPKILHIRISCFVLLFLCFVELIAQRKGLRVLTPITLTFSTFFIFLFLRTLFEINDFSLTGTDKSRFVGLFQLINGPIFLFWAGFILQSFPERSKRLFYFMWGGFFLTCIALFFLNYSVIRMEAVRTLIMTEEGRNYDAIGIGRVLGAGVIISIVYFQHTSKYCLKIVAGITCGFFLSVMVLTNERGPVVSLLMVIIIILLVHRHKIKRQIWIMVFSIGALWIGFTFMDPLHNRFLMALTAGIGQESRWSLFAKALHVFLDNSFVGTGYGGFNFVMGGGYPHNIFLECLTESGVIGLAIFIFWLRNIFCTLHRMFGESLQFTMATYLFIYYLLNAQVSGSLAGNAPLFLFAGIIAGREALQRTGQISELHTGRRFSL